MNEQRIREIVREELDKRMIAIVPQVVVNADCAGIDIDTIIQRIEQSLE